MYFNNALCKALTLPLIETGNPQAFEWASSVGELPSEWNHLVNYDTPRRDAKLVHFTQGLPCFKETAGCEYHKEWLYEQKLCNSTVPWSVLMGVSVHAKPVLDRLAREVA